MAFCYTQLPFQSSSEMLLPATDGNKYRDPKPHITQRAAEIGILSPISNVYNKSLPSRLREPCRRRGKKSLRARGDGEHPKNKAL